MYFASVFELLCSYKLIAWQIMNICSVSHYYFVSLLSTTLLSHYIWLCDLLSTTLLSHYIWLCDLLSTTLLSHYIWLCDLS